MEGRAYTLVDHLLALGKGLGAELHSDLCGRVVHEIRPEKLLLLLAILLGLICRLLWSILV